MKYSSAIELANFLHNNSQNISKSKLGEFFGEEAKFNLEVFKNLL